MSVAAKICGLSTPESVVVSVESGAALVGFVFYPPSPRTVTAEIAGKLAAVVPDGVAKVALFVDAEDDAIEAVLAAAAMDYLQLHGSEDPARVAEIRARFDVPVIKAVKIENDADVRAAHDYEEVSDWLLFDAKAPKTMPGALPGGNALSFDWGLLQDREWSRPWMLSGGLDAANVAEAVATTGAGAVDVSSGVEDEPGQKDPDRIKAFLDAVAAL